MTTYKSDEVYLKEFKEKYWTQLIDEYGDEHLFDSITDFLIFRRRVDRQGMMEEVEKVLFYVFGYIGDDEEQTAAINRWNTLKPEIISHLKEQKG